MKNFPRPVRCTLQSPWGAMTLAATEDALVWVGFDGQKHDADTQAWPLSHQHPVLCQTRIQLEQYFAAQRREFDIPLMMAFGTPFQQQVWQQLRHIGAGSTSTYGAIARALGNPNAMRAVGAAVGRNPISIIVPCHRVLGSNGSLTGFAGGLDRKQALLRLEGLL